MTRQGLRIRIPGEEQYAALFANHRCKDMFVPLFMKAIFMPAKVNLHTSILYANNGYHCRHKLNRYT